MSETIKCLYCNSDNISDDEICSHCGMPLPDIHPHSAEYRRGRFKWWYWGIVIFCILMMIYLPR